MREAAPTEWYGASPEAEPLAGYTTAVPNAHRDSAGAIRDPPSPSPVPAFFPFPLYALAHFAW